MDQDLPLDALGASADELAELFGPVAADGPTVDAHTATEPAGAAPEPATPLARPSLAEVIAGLDEAGRDGLDEAAAQADTVRRAERVVLFDAGGTRYGVRVPEIVEVGRIPAITPVPQLPPWVRGVTNLRGDVVSVIDLSAFIGIEPTPLNSGRMLVAKSQDDDFTIGILVDRVLEIAATPTSELRQPTAPLDGPLAPFLRGVYERQSQVVALLDVHALLRSPDVRRFEEEASYGD
jgi:purine-binding chemotaxis protein CheW